jgi:beta-aspartyl-dipeptidase (metallo-type)
LFKLFKNGRCLTPDDIGIKDILVVCDKICAIREEISPENLWDVQVIDCTGCIICPGFIDQHAHITGGGGEQGPISRIPELMFSQVIKAGVTTIVGVLGFDSISRSIAGLLAKARGLEAEGITAYIYTGSYGSPTETLTGRVLTDIVLLDKVIGVGEIAISDCRSFHPSLQDLRVLASEAYGGGMLGDKAGILHLHVGDGKEGLEPLFRLIDESDFPVEMFVPTHINRHPGIFSQGIKLLQRGGNIDLTAGETAGYSVMESLKILLDEGHDISRVTVSSDAQGSAPAKTPADSGVNNIEQLFQDIKACVVENHLDLSAVIKTVTINPAKILKIYPQKGILAPGSDADILVLQENDLSIFRLMAKGQMVVENQNPIKKGRYEK